MKPKQYVFEFSGTKEDFLKPLKRSDVPPGAIVYHGEYMIEFADSEIRFGIERCGHSGGNWYVATVDESDGRMAFCGEIRYVGPERNDDNRGWFGKTIEKIGLWFFFILFLPFWILFELYTFVRWLVRKLRRRSHLNPKTTEEKLFYLMETVLHCVRKEDISD
ncbi:MAG: hypothetical protein J6S34_02460 [Clostridia bacterium]|nr:hypothetical protein [Clostridia bacterium]